MVERLLVLDDRVWVAIALLPFIFWVLLAILIIYRPDKWVFGTIEALRRLGINPLHLVPFKLPGATGKWAPVVFGSDPVTPLPDYRSMTKLEILLENLGAERESVVHHERLTARIHSPALKEELTALAVEDSEHAQWLLEKIVALGGAAADGYPQLPAGETVAEDILLDWRHEGQFLERLKEQLKGMEEGDIKELLAKLCQAEKGHLERIQSVALRYS